MKTPLIVQKCDQVVTNKCPSRTSLLLEGGVLIYSVDD